MPKILLGVSSSYCASFLRGQVSFLKKNGYEVLVVSGPGPEIRYLAETEGAKLYEVDFTKKITPFKDLVILLQLVRLLKKEKPDIVNAGNPKSGFLIMLACWLTRQRKRVFTMHGLLSDTQKGGREKLIAATERIACNVADRVIVVSRSLQHHAEKRKLLPAGKSVIIENGSCNGINTAYFSRTQALHAAAMTLKKDLGLTEGPVLGFVGRISKDKGVDQLLEVFNTLKVLHPDLQLLLAGPVEEDTEGIAGIRNALARTKDVFCTGMLFDVRVAYMAMDILVLPSLREGLPNVLLEASSMELPVVASDIPGCRDAITVRLTGELFPKNDRTALKEILEKLIGNEGLRRQYGMNGRKFVEEHFLDEKIWQGQLKLYGGL